MKTTVTATAMIALLTTPALGQDAEFFALDEIVFSANLFPVSADRTGARVDVIGEDDLEGSEGARLSDVLDTRPGISITTAGPIGGEAKLRLRGLDAKYVPVYINGIDMTDPSLTQSYFNFGTLTGAGLSRVEVLTGSQSALYGSEAIGGVISIETASAPEEIGAEGKAEIEAGSYETYRASLSYGIRTERSTFAVSASRITSEGFSAANEADGNTEADGHDATTITLKGSYQLTDTVEVGGSLFYSNSRTEQDGYASTFPYAFGDTDDYDQVRTVGARAFATVEAFGIDNEFAVSRTMIDREYPLSSFNTRFDGDRTEFSYKGTAEIGADATLVFGLQSSTEGFVSDTDSGEHRINSVFADYSRALTGDLDLAVSLRHDNHSEFGGATTGRAALAWRPSEGTVVRASVGTGFRAPSLYELYSTFYGNPALEPETSQSAELGVEHDFGNGLTVQGTVFASEITDLIAWTDGGTPWPDTDDDMYYQVPGTSRIQGIELSADYDMGNGTTLFGNYTRTIATDGAGERLVRVPGHDLTLGLSAEFGMGIAGGLTLQRVMDRVDVSGPMPDYTLVNAAFSYDLNDRTEVRVRVDNLLDTDYESVDGYGTSGRAIYVGLATTF